MTTISDRLIPEAYYLAARGAIAMAEQDRFARLHLSSDGAQKYLAICLRVRENKIEAGQSLLDAVAAIIAR